MDGDGTDGRDSGEPAGGWPVLNPAGEAPRLDVAEDGVWLRIPPEIQKLKEQDAVAARRWREQTRSAFEAYLGRGYVVSELVRDEVGSRYLLRRSR
jgi:predicted GNAT superfamily acetyltransferase